VERRLETQPGTLGAYPDTVAALRKTLEDQGIEFSDGDVLGVRLRKVLVAMKLPTAPKAAARKSSRSKRR
jgi:hypothetical protein